MRWGRSLAWIGGGVIVVGAALFGVLQTPPGTALVAAIASSDSIKVEGISGFIPIDVRVAKVELRDKKGVWLSLDDARVDWSFSSLFSGRVRIEQLSARQVEVLRAPQPNDETSKSAVTDNSISVPLGIDLRALSIDDLHVGAELGGVDSHWKVSGSGLVTADGTPSRLEQLSKRIFRALHLTGYARMDFRLREDGQLFVLEANANPNISAAEDLAQSALTAGLSYDELLSRIVHLGQNYPAAWRAAET